MSRKRPPEDVGNQRGKRAKDEKPKSINQLLKDHLLDGLQAQGGRKTRVAKWLLKLLCLTDINAVRRLDHG